MPGILALFTVSLLVDAHKQCPGQGTTDGMREYLYGMREYVYGKGRAMLTA